MNTVENLMTSHNNGNALVVGSLFSRHELKIKYVFKNQENGIICSIVFNYQEIFNGECEKQCKRLSNYSVIATCLFIGMFDKYETEIYEGDILKCYNNAALDFNWGLDKQHIGIIEYRAPCFSLKVPGKLDYDGGAVKHWSNDVYLDMWCNAENIEKLGNIFQNPELLDGVQ